MNKDIQTLIEKEACKHWSQSNYKEVAEKAHSENDMCKTSAMSRKVSNSSFQAGASFALSLFKWRKVSEVLPEEDDCRCSLPVLIKNKYNTYRVARYSYKYNDFVIGETSISGVIEWMPIPQID